MKKLYLILLYSGIFCLILDLMFTCFDLMIYALIFMYVSIVLILVSVILYFTFVKHKCPKCNTVFNGNRWEVFFAPHTPTRRKMRCPMCNEKVWCEDFFGKIEKEKKENE